MSLFSKPKVLTLDDWLAIATGKLAEPARERIRAEIEAHYAEARDAHQEDGMSKYDAHLAALEDLGDATVAATRFRKEHLTEHEAVMLKLWDRQGANLIHLFLWYIIAGFCLFWERLGDRLQIRWISVPHGNYMLLAMGYVVIFCGVLPTVRFIAARRGGAILNRNLLLVQALSLGGAGLLLYSLSYGMTPIDHPLMQRLLETLTIPLCFLHAGLSLFRIWRKVGKNGMIPDYAPPANTTEISS